MYTSRPAVAARGWQVLMTIVAYILLGYIVAVTFVLLRRSVIVEAAYAVGYRRAIKDAVLLAEEHGNNSILGAPPGEMTIGVIRATTAHELALKLRDLRL